MNNQQKINWYGGAQRHKDIMIIGAIAISLLFSGQKDALFPISPTFAISHDTGAIQGRRIDQNGSLSNVAATITITNTGLTVNQSLTSNPYTSGLIPAGTYTVSSSQPAGYNVSYSTSPTGGPSTYVAGTVATVTVTPGQTVNLWWKYAPIAGTAAIQGYRVDQNGATTNIASTITISGVGPLTGNPYNSGSIGPGTYTVSSSQPTGYSVSYSTNPAGGASTYISGSVATVTVTAGQTVNLWWKYKLVTNSIQGYQIDQNEALSSVGATITISGVGSFTTNPYNSGQINPGTYTVSSSQPAGYSVSYSTDPTGGASTYITGTTATITVTTGNIILWWKYTPIVATSIKGSIQGSHVDVNGSPSSVAATITISGVGSFTGSPYNSGQITQGTYTVSSSQPAGYSVSYSTNPAGGAATYVSGSITTVQVIAGQITNLWWKYTPVATTSTTGAIQGFRVDQDGKVTTVSANITINGVGSFTANPYNSGQIQAAPYTVSSAKPAGYDVSYSTNPAAGSSSYVAGTIATVTVTAGQIVNVWWKYTPITSSIQGYKVDENGQPISALAQTPITIYGVGAFTANPYDSGQIALGTYTVSSAEPSGYHVSYSTNPEGGDAGYTSGSTAVVSVSAGQITNLWWKYTPVPHLSAFTLELDNLQSSYSPSVLTHKEIRRMWFGSLTNNFSPAIHSSPDLSNIPRADNIFYSEYINGSWTKPLPERTFQKPGFQINDPSVMAYPGVASLIYMYYTALADEDAKQQIFDRHKIGLALSIDEGQSWQDKGIVVDYPESGDGKGASSPSAIAVDDEIWVYYHTAASDFSKPINWRVKFSLKTFSILKTGLPERLHFDNFIPDDPNWILSNLDVSYRNSQFVMLANTSDLKKVVRFVSDDGINWRKPTGGQDPMIEISNYLALTPTAEDTSPSRYKIFFGLGATSGSNIVSTMIRSTEFSTTASVPLTPVSFVFTTDMSIGETSEDVRALQACLSRDSSIYPEGLITGYFGSLTHKAVIRFQEKFASVILTPAGLVNGTGFVGSLTRQKLNQVCAQ